MFCLSPYRKSSLCSACHGLAKCHCSPQSDIAFTFPRGKPLASAQPKEIIVLTRDFTHLPQTHLRSVDEQPTVSSDGDCCGKTSAVEEKSVFPRELHSDTEQHVSSIAGYWISPLSQLVFTGSVLYCPYRLLFVFPTVTSSWIILLLCP